MGSKYVYTVELVSEGGERQTAESIPMTRAAAQRAANELNAMGYKTTVRALEPEKVNTHGKRGKSGAKVISGSLHTEED